MEKIKALFTEWQSLQPLKEEDQRRLDQKFMLEFNYNSNHIEGNTLTYGQTEMLLMFGKVVDDANMKDLEEMKASNVGLKMIREMARDKEQPLTESFIRNLHKTLLREDYTVYRQLPDGTNTSYVVHAGQYKTRPNSVITVTGERFEYASQEETPALMADLIHWYNEAESEGKLTPIELASLFHYRYIRIHPFEDGNGRVSRLLVNYILARHGYPMIVVKSEDKNNYLTALNRCDVVIGPIPSVGAHAELSQIMPFVEYMSICLERAFNISIRAAKGESIEDKSDWRKNLILKYRDKINKPEVTEGIKNKIKEDFSAMLRKIDDELSPFYSIFTSINRNTDEVNHFVELGNNQYYQNISFNNVVDKHKVNISFYIKLTIQQFLYRIEVIQEINQLSTDTLFCKELPYTEIFKEQDSEDLINKIGSALSQFLES